MNGLSPLRIFYFHLTLSLPVFQLYLLPSYFLQYYGPFKAQIQNLVWSIDRASQLFLPSYCGELSLLLLGAVLSLNSVLSSPSLRQTQIQYSPILGVTFLLMWLAEHSSSSPGSHICLIHHTVGRQACRKVSTTGQLIVTKNLLRVQIT